MVNFYNQQPFFFFFIDDELPSCFNQRKGTTFRSLLYPEQEGGRKTYKNLTKRFQKKRQERLMFEKCFSELQQVSKREDFFQQKFVHKIDFHANRNGLVEWVFGDHGRIDACILEKDGVKCVFIFDIRPLSGHEGISDDEIHKMNRALALGITNAFRCSNFFKTKGVPFRQGLFAYQNEYMQNINTTEARFYILVNTVEGLIFANKTVHEHIVFFQNKLMEELKTLSDTEKKEFSEYIEQQLASSNIKGYQRELFDKLYHYDYVLENHLQLENDLAISFSNISNTRRLATSFFNSCEEAFACEEPRTDVILNLFKIFSKIPLNYLYVLDDVFEDKDFTTDEILLQNKLEYFLRRLHSFEQGETAYSSFENIFKDAFCKSDFQSIHSVSEMSSWKPSISKKTKDNNVFQNFINIDTNHLLNEQNVEKFAHALIKFMVEETHNTMVTLVDEHADEQTFNDSNTLGFQWLDNGNVDETFLSFFQNFLNKNKELAKSISLKYPFLEPFIKNIKNNTFEKLDKLHTICELYHSYYVDPLEDKFESAYKQLEALSETEKILLKVYFLNIFSNSTNHAEIENFITNSLLHIKEKEHHAQKISQEKQSRKTTSKKEENQKTDKDILRQNFIDVFNEFYSDIYNLEKLNRLKEVVLVLDQSLLNRLKKLPSNNPAGIFIRDYLYFKERDNTDQPIENAIKKLVSRVQANKKNNFENAIHIFFDHPNTTSAQEKLRNTLSLISKQDIDYCLSVWEQAPETYSRQVFFAQSYIGHEHEDFYSFLRNTQQEFSYFLANEIKNRIRAFRIGFQNLISVGTDEAIEHLAFVCAKLTPLDFKIMLKNDSLDLLDQEKDLLQNIQQAKSKSSKDVLSEIYDHVATTKRQILLQYTFNKFVHNMHDEEIQKRLLQAILDIKKDDLNIFITNNSKSKIVSKFFENLQKIKRKKLSSEAEKDDITLEVQALKRKVFFYNCVNTFLADGPQGENQNNLTRAFLNFTKDGYKELNEVLSETKEDYALQYLLSNMRLLKDKHSNLSFNKVFDEFIHEKSVLIDFFVAVDQCESQHQTENISTILQCLELHEIEAILNSHVYDNHPFMTSELKKQQFCRAINDFAYSNFKDRDLERKVVSLYSALTSTNLFDDILRETPLDSAPYLFIIGAREYFKDTMRTGLSGKQLSHKQIKTLLPEHDTIGYEKNLKKILGIPVIKDKISKFIHDLKNKNLPEAVYSKIKANNQRT